MTTRAPRPPKKPAAEGLSSVVLIRMTPTEREAFERLAQTDNRSLSAWVRMACREKAKREGVSL